MLCCGGCFCYLSLKFVDFFFSFLCRHFNCSACGDGGGGSDLISGCLWSFLCICGSGGSQRLVQYLNKILGSLLLFFTGFLPHSQVAFVSLDNDFFCQKDGRFFYWNFSLHLPWSWWVMAHVTVYSNFGLSHAYMLRGSFRDLGRSFIWKLMFSFSGSLLSRVLPCCQVAVVSLSSFPCFFQLLIRWVFLKLEFRFLAPLPRLWLFSGQNHKVKLTPPQSLLSSLDFSSKHVNFCSFSRALSQLFLYVVQSLQTLFLGGLICQKLTLPFQKYTFQCFLFPRST